MEQLEEACLSCKRWQISARVASHPDLMALVPLFMAQKGNYFFTSPVAGCSQQQPQSSCLIIKTASIPLPRESNHGQWKTKNITQTSKETMSRSTELYLAQIFQKDKDFHGSAF